MVYTGDLTACLLLGKAIFLLGSSQFHRRVQGGLHHLDYLGVKEQVNLEGVQVDWDISMLKLFYFVAGHALAGLLLNLNLFPSFAQKKENHLNYQGYADSFLRMDYLLNRHMITL
ncbi:hypothetical protein OIU74_011037 [Salix koriyanagi]|uniref:Uncharacterized protein n=1 Tax=Salix koriyanagi TaxID=2511006 RepID=A0A9Q0TEA0_9ROSI|nr:hypothetical protein OIU74_011037 [Salix koriyanagi]